MNIESIERRLLVKYPPFGSILANTNFVADSTLKTAGTDGENIYYNPRFIESLTNDEQLFVFAHEVCHIAFNHIFRREGKDKNIWNKATDAVVNAILKDDGLPLVKGGVDMSEAIDYDAEEMYQKLLEEKQQKQDEKSDEQDQKDNQHQNSESEEEKEQSQEQSDSSEDNSQNQEQDQENQQNNDGGQSGNEQEQSQKQNDSSEGNSHNQEQDQEKQSKNQSNGESSEESQEEKESDVGHDTHSLWDKAIEKKHQEEQSQSTGQSNDKNKNTDGESLLEKIRKKFDKKNEMSEKQQNPSESRDEELENEEKEEIKKLTELGEKEAFKQIKKEREKQLEKLREGLVKQSLGYGDTTDSERWHLTNIGTSKPIIDWRRLLKEAVKYDVDWSYQNAGVEDGVITPYLEETPRPETEIVLDTSGSVDETLLRNFLKECKNILETSKVKVGCFDTQFYGFTEIKSVQDIDNLVFLGGGGTNFNAAVNAFTNRVENKIIFTDGNAPMPFKPIDAIWVVFGETEINPIGGKVIHIDNEQLERLYNYQMDDETIEMSR